ncbi:MAG: hypothetical protein QOG03_1010 [Actinomycetota bacterium]|jgi:hypothetical protein|nr:hypothetical protein [Actinomycetota bacterium]
MSSRRRLPAVPAWAVVGGLTAVLVALFLPWQTVSGCCEAPETTTNGWHWPAVAILAGAALAFVGLLRWRRGDAISAGSAIVVAGVAADWVATRRSLFPSTVHGTTIGLALALAGGLVALLGSLPLVWAPADDDDQRADR